MQMSQEHLNQHIERYRLDTLLAHRFIHLSFKIYNQFLKYITDQVSIDTLGRCYREHQNSFANTNAATAAVKRSPQIPSHQSNYFWHLSFFKCD
jgi:hypothetical protein